MLQNGQLGAAPYCAPFLLVAGSPASLSHLSALHSVASKVRPWKPLPSVGLEGQLPIGCRIQKLELCQVPPRPGPSALGLTQSSLSNR